MRSINYENLRKLKFVNKIEKKARNEKLLKLVEMFADKMIELSSNNNCPIDYVIANKSGILDFQ